MNTVIRWRKHSFYWLVDKCEDYSTAMVIHDGQHIKIIILNIKLNFNLI